jgi:hypothetical protein
MRYKLALPVAMTATVALAVLAASTAVAAPSKTFTASYKGKVTERVSGKTVYAAAKGAGTGNLVGKSSITGNVVADTSNPPCGPFSGPGSIKSGKGLLKVKAMPGSRGCAAGEDDQNNISLSGTVKILRGTGKFAKTRGSLHFSGHYDRGSGAFNVKLTGKVTL